MTGEFPMLWPFAYLAFAVLALVAYCASVNLFAAPKARPGWAEALSACVLGLACLGLLLMLMRWWSWPFWIAAVPLLTAAGLSAYRRRGDLRPAWPERAGFGLAATAAVLFLLPALIGGALMGSGDYPAMFFQAATPFRLTHAYQFIADRGLPPQSLSNLGLQLGYHFGASATAAAVALFTGLKAHSAFFLTLVLSNIGVVAITWLIAACVAENLPFALRFPLILTAAPFMAWSFGKIFDDWVSDSQLFFNHYPDISTYYGIFLFLVVLYSCLNLGERRFPILAAAATILLAAAKSSFYPAAGLLLACSALVKLYETRDLRWLIWPFVAFVGGVGFIRLTGHAIAGELVFEPFFLVLQLSKKAVKFGLDIALYLVPVVCYGLGVAHRRALSKDQKQRLVALGLTVVALYLFVNTLGHYYVDNAGVTKPNDIFLLPLRLAPKILAVGALLALGALWDPGRRKSNAVVLAYLSLLIVVPLAHRTTQAALLVLAPEKAHEYVDNRAIGEALSHIPISGSVVVTNDLRYPANGFKRDLAQMQIPALFGHQAYAANILYERYPDEARRLALQRRLAQRHWDPELTSIAEKEGWTHLLIHKLAPYPAEIPLTKLFENERYIVYEFE